MYINDIINCFTDNDVNLVLYADDTNIFITGDSRQDLIEKANNVLIKVNKFMKSNLLHINLGKCCFMHFNPTTKCNENSINNEQQQDDEILRINETPIPEVSSTKFLGVTIDNRLSWTPHINDLHKKLKSATGMLKRMRDNIPEEHYKQRNKNFRETRILNLCYYYMKYLNYRETLYSMYDHYSSLILFQKEAEQRSTRTIRFRVTKTPLWDSFS